MGRRRREEISAPSPQFCSKPVTSLKQVSAKKKKKDEVLSAGGNRSLRARPGPGVAVGARATQPGRAGSLPTPGPISWHVRPGPRGSRCGGRRTCEGSRGSQRLSPPSRQHCSHTLQAARTHRPCSEPNPSPHGCCQTLAEASAPTGGTAVFPPHCPCPLTCPPAGWQPWERQKLEAPAWAGGPHRHGRRIPLLEVHLPALPPSLPPPS